ncbi:hypothetical protein [Pseudarthrobacter sp. PvP090]|uniref:hypothetical protein n=1 Tax=Pseudarthrobacter sp. PvP090 TaxID=3156393 RepID=UPI003395A182
MIEGPLTDLAYSLARAKVELAVQPTYDLQQLRENTVLARDLALMHGQALQSMYDVVEDVKLREALRAASERRDRRRVEDTIDFGQLSVEPLLNAFGYKPPPPPYELVGRTQAALLAAGEASRQTQTFWRGTWGCEALPPLSPC